MIRVGITGQSGFIGTHLAQTVASAADMELIPFEDAFFTDEDKLRTFVKSCDAIMHLAAMSRAPSEEVLYETNTGLVKKLIAAMDAEDVNPHVLFASSVHETRNTAYGRAKREGRTLLAQRAEKRGTPFTAFIIPNVFGSGARVFYASFIANFAWQLNHGQEPTIQVDAPIRLIYVDHLMKIITQRIRAVAANDFSGDPPVACIAIPCDFEKKVSEVLALFRSFKDAPPAADADDNVRNLYDTFISYADREV